MKNGKFLKYILVAVSAAIAFSLFACTNAPDVSDETVTSGETAGENEETTNSLPPESETDTDGGEETSSVSSEETVEPEPDCYHGDLESVAAKEPTCTEVGNEAYTLCKLCGAVFNGDGEELVGIPEIGALSHAWLDATLDTPMTCRTCGATTGGTLEIQQDNAFSAADLFAAYKANPTTSFSAELVTEGDVTFFRATAREAELGKLVLNSGKNTVSGVGKSFIVVYRNKTAAINRVVMEINSAGKTNNAGGANPYFAISKSEDWSIVTFSTSSSVDLSGGAGYMSIDVFAKDSAGQTMTQVGDVMDILFVAAVESEDSAKNLAGSLFGSFLKFPYAANIPGVILNGVKENGTAVLPNGQQAVDKPIEMNMAGVKFDGLASVGFRLGAGWVVTRGGWDHFEYVVATSDGAVSEAKSFSGSDLGGSTISALMGSYPGYGADLGKGGSLFSPVTIDLSAYEGKTVNIEIYGISNFGMSYKIVNLKSLSVPSWDNVFTAHDLLVGYNNLTSAAYKATYKAEVLNEGGVTFFRATALQSGKCRLVLNTSSSVISPIGNTFMLVYRNNSATSPNKFQLYMKAQGSTTTMIPAISRENTDNWRVAVFTYSTSVDFSSGVGMLEADLFYNDAVAGDTVDIALFAAVSDVEEAWSVFSRELGNTVGLPYANNIMGITVGGTAYKDEVLTNGQKTVDAPVIIDLEGIDIPADLNLASGIKLGAGYTVTRGGYDYFICNVTSESGLKKSYRIFEGADLGGDTLAALKNEFSAYGDDLGVGGNLFSPLTVDLSGFAGERVTVEIVGISNIGKKYEIARIVNLTLPGVAEYAKLDDFISFFDYTVPTALKSVSLKNGDKLGVSFTVPKGEQVRELKLGIANTVALNSCSIGVSIYNFNGSYAESVGAEPIYHTVVTDVIKWANIVIPDGKMPEGRYLVVVEYVAAEGNALATVMTDNAWKTLPDELSEYAIVSYKNGSVDSSAAIAGGIETVKIGNLVPENDKIDVEFEEKSAKVIVILGQSNAAGTSMNSWFQNAVSSELYAKYANGFSNVKMLYHCGAVSNSGLTYPNVKDSFVDVKLGQGYVSWAFGPEIGLAEYLSETYPDETFYIIKYAVGGTSMDSFWNVNDPNAMRGIVELQETLNKGLGILEGEGLTPEILGFIWMQGEGDCGSSANRAYPYYNTQKALMSFLRETYSQYSPDGGEIPFIDAEISDLGNWTASYIINDAKKEIDRESRRNYLIDTNFMGLTTLYENNDLAHYDSTSMLTLGYLFAKTLDNIYDF